MRQETITAKVPARPTRQRSVRKSTRRGRRYAPENETARARFLRIGQPRVVNAVKAIRLLGNLARGSYEWHESDVLAMRSIIQAELDATVQEFNRSQKKGSGIDFHFEIKELEAALQKA